MASTPGFIWWEASALTTAPPLLADSAHDSRDSPVATRRMDQPLLIFQLIHRIESFAILVILVWLTNFFWHTVYQLISGLLTLTKRRTGQLTGEVGGRADWSRSELWNVFWLWWGLCESYWRRSTMFNLLSGFATTGSHQMWPQIL